LYAGLAEQDQHPIAKLKTFERLDELEGIQIEKRQREQTGERQPMFLLPAGAR
jgi:hypothetical protein